MNSEDVILYRWDLARNTLAEKIRLNPRTLAGTTPPATGTESDEPLAGRQLAPFGQLADSLLLPGRNFKLHHSRA